MTEQKPIEQQSDREIVATCNALARQFYRRMGYMVPEGYRFDRVSHPQEVMVWEMASDALELLTGTEIQNALEGEDDDESDDVGGQSQ